MQHLGHVTEDTPQIVFEPALELEWELGPDVMVIFEAEAEEDVEAAA